MVHGSCLRHVLTMLLFDREQKFVTENSVLEDNKDLYLVEYECLSWHVAKAVNARNELLHPCGCLC